MIKQRVKILVVGVLVVLIGMGGCKKCYECASLISWYKCYKGTDTLRFQFFYKISAEDSIDYYTGQGYTCQLQDRFYSLQYHGNPICGEKEIREQMRLTGDSCYAQN